MSHPYLEATRESNPPGSWPAVQHDSPLLDESIPKDSPLPDKSIPKDPIEASDAIQNQDIIEAEDEGGSDTGAQKIVIAGHRMLPPEILEQILYLTDPESFASLILVDQAWRAASQTPHLYAYHLSRCPSFSLNNIVVDAGPFTDDSLSQLKRKFAQEVKRNLFEAYLQPRRTVVSLFSTTTSSSAAIPGGEAFDFSFSPNGHWTLALSSSRLYVLDTVSPKISVQRELKVLRRPVAAAILDDGSKLAVLSSDHHVNFYDLTMLKTKHSRSISLDNPPHAIALAPKGDVLAAAFDGGVEVHSLAPNAPNTDRRTVKCDRVDSLSFSFDGTMLLGTTRNSKTPNTVILSAPYYTADSHEMPASNQIGHIWTSQIIFPNSSRDCSHATLLPNRSDGDANWTFTYDRVFESFRAVRIDDLRNGTTYFTGPRPPPCDGPRASRKKLTPCTLPASSYCGELVAAGFSGKDIWIYGVPEGLDTSTVTQTDDPNPQNVGSSVPGAPSSGLKSPSRSITGVEDDELTRLPKWQVLVDKYRNVFAKGRRIAEIPGVSSMCWVSRKHERGPRSIRERLLIAAPGGIAGDPELEQDDYASVDGGRLIILDFDRTIKDGKIEEIRFEVGNAIPEILEEENMDMETEVALARRRTIRKDINAGTTVADQLASAPEMPPLPFTTNAVANTRTSSSTIAAAADTRQEPVAASFSPAEGLSMEEASQVFDGPYSHTQPRSRTSLYRSATAVAASRLRNPPRIVQEARIEYRRPDGRGDIPHESDADNWVPPPPPYAPEADRPLPDHLRRTLMPRSTEPISRPQTSYERPRRASTTPKPRDPSTPSRRISSLPERSSLPLRPIHSEAPAQTRRIELSGSNILSQEIEPVSPLSSAGFSFDDPSSESATPSRRATSATSHRRPISAYVGRLAGSLRRPNIARLTSPVASMPAPPPVPEMYRQQLSVSLPPSPTRTMIPNSPLTLTGANLQQRLEYPLPPAPTNSSTESVNQPDLAALNMPSAQQLDNLNNRYRHPPPLQAGSSGRPQLPVIATPGYPTPSPPRAALGAAGSPSPYSLHSPARSLSARNSMAQSSPALLRPSTRRLETIESISSFVSRSRTRSAPRAASRDLTAEGRKARRRSRSLGPALRLDSTATRKGLLGGRRGRRGRGRGGDEIICGEGGKGSKCTVM